jgi:hypothetical protein
VYLIIDDKMQPTFSSRVVKELFYPIHPIIFAETMANGTGVSAFELLFVFADSASFTLSFLTFLGVFAQAHATVQDVICTLRDWQQHNRVHSAIGNKTI